LSKPPEKKITALVVDDEDLARLVLRELIQTHPEIAVLAECGNGFEAVKAVAEHKPDLDRHGHRGDFRHGL
jgi:chemotaxis response regulator CheB